MPGLAIVDDYFVFRRTTEGLSDPRKFNAFTNEELMEVRQKYRGTFALYRFRCRTGNISSWVSCVGERFIRRYGLAKPGKYLTKLRVPPDYRGQEMILYGSAASVIAQAYLHHRASYWEGPFLEPTWRSVASWPLDDIEIPPKIMAKEIWQERLKAGVFHWAILYSGYLHVFPDKKSFQMAMSIVDGMGRQYFDG